MEIGQIKDRKITEEMKESYLDYALSVIVSRALPDVRDGLKPVHRRILYAMDKLGLRSSAKFRKSATVVGEVLGKYHPHSDAAVYESMVNLAQDFKMLHPLVNGQGNFGSMDGDSAAAMRYTEAKIMPIAEEMLKDIEKETVNFVDNYDGTRQEPTVLPAAFPQLLVNGTMGIAVGLATDILPHNLGEVVDATIHLADNPSATVEDLTNFVKGPDFPTGGIIYDKNEILQTFATGRGKIISRAKVEIQEPKEGKFQIVVTEMTFRTNKATLLEKIANLVKEKKIEEIRDLRDESDQNVRVVIELKQDAYPNKALNKLYKYTDLQKAFHPNMLALVDGIQPKVLNLKAMLEYYIIHRKEIVTRRTVFDLNKAKERAHILEGLKKALDHIDEVIATIKKSETKEVAHKNLIKKFGLSDRQTTAILEMRLQTLAGLEQKKIEDELKEKMALIKKLEDILKDPKKILKIIKDELTDIKNRFAKPRKTKIFANAVGEFAREDLIPNEETVITLTNSGYIKRLNPETYKVQKRGGKGVIGMTPKEEDVVDHMLVAETHDVLLFFTNRGRAFQIKAYETPVASRTAKGSPIVNFLQMAPDEKVTVVLAIKTKGDDFVYSDSGYLFMVTKAGVVKRTPLEDFTNVRRSGLIAISLNKGDELGWVRLTSGKDEIMLSTKNGQAIRCKETDIRSMGRSAIGVRGIRLKSGDSVVGACMIVGKKEEKEKLEVLVLTENGYGKRTALGLYKVQKRGGSGIKTVNVTSKTGKLIFSAVIQKDSEEEDLIVISRKGQVIRLETNTISKLGRSTQGVRVMRMASGDRVASATRT
ncbi:DNA gyrase subunit A [bacterium]|nr:MAG: DNA gyrase subunit A [bacterium]